jgi:hypothetical protein
MLIIDVLKCKVVMQTRRESTQENTNAAFLSPVTFGMLEGFVSFCVPLPGA